MKASIALSLLILSSLPVSAATLIPREDLFRLGFTPPEFTKIHLDDLSLDASQRERIGKLLDTNENTMPGLQMALKDQGKALESAVQAATPKLDEAEAILNHALETEAAIKRLQLHTILGISTVLTPEQRAKALELAKKDVELEASVRTLAERFRTALDSLGVKPTPAMQERGEQIKPLIESGQFAAAMEALQAAAKDFGLDEQRTPETLDFSKFEPGITELTQLQQRYADVEQRIQKVVRLALLQQLVQAHTELESAKAAQDATAVGRILTWAEGVLP